MADGPGIGTICISVLDMADINSNPGSLIPGVPASVTSETSPDFSSSIIMGILLDALCLLKLIIRVVIENSWRSFPVTLVSSAAISCEVFNVWIARFVISDKLPMGVPTTYRFVIY